MKHTAVEMLSEVSLPGTPVSGSRLCRTYGAPGLAIDIPGLPAWADVWTIGPLGLDDAIDWTFLLTQTLQPVVVSIIERLKSCPDTKH